VPPNIARALRGFYGEAGYRIWDAGAPRDLVTFVRYENFDTQFRMPAGLLPLKEFDRDAWVTGRDVLPGSRRGSEGGLHLSPQQERRLRQQTVVQRRTRLVVLGDAMTIRFLVVLPLLLAGTPSRSAGSRSGIASRHRNQRGAFPVLAVSDCRQEGEELELRLRSDDTIHGFRIVGQGTNLEIPKRGHGYAVTRFTAAARPIHVRVQSSLRRRPQFHARRDRRAARRDRSNAMTRVLVGRRGRLVRLARSFMPRANHRPRSRWRPLPGITATEFSEFRLGLDDFTEVETAEEGLGPPTTERAAPCVTTCPRSAAAASFSNCAPGTATAAARTQD
jgi:hypothetical protein